MDRSRSLVWIDMEMTGLDPDTDRILEIATLITDAELNIIAEGPDIVLHQPSEVLARMDEWNQSHHGASGLLAQVRASSIDEEEATRLTLDFLKAHCTPRSMPLAGNSIYQDRRFLARYMPTVSAYLHYRHVDVSTIKELAFRWLPDVAKQTPKKQNNHRALDDIRESIEELRYYRAHVFRAP
jgi:oligoribonuclease